MLKPAAAASASALALIASVSGLAKPTKSKIRMPPSRVFQHRENGLNSALADAQAGLENHQRALQLLDPVGLLLILRPQRGNLVLKGIALQADRVQLIRIAGDGRAPEKPGSLLCFLARRILDRHADFDIGALAQVVEASARHIQPRERKGTGVLPVGDLERSTGRTGDAARGVIPLDLQLTVALSHRKSDWLGRETRSEKPQAKNRHNRHRQDNCDHPPRPLAAWLGIRKILRYGWGRLPEQGDIMQSGWQRFRRSSVMIKRITPVPGRGSVGSNPISRRPIGGGRTIGKTEVQITA